MDLPTFHCDTCNTDICPRAEQVGCFEVQMEPPNSKRIYWVDIRLLEEQKHLSLRKTTFSGAWPRDEASLRCLNLRARARMGKAEGVWLADGRCRARSRVPRVPKVCPVVQACCVRSVLR
jgi:hypothetical protein